VNTQTESVTPGGVASGAVNLPLGASWAATLRGTVRHQNSYHVGAGGTQPNTDARSWNGTAGMGYIGTGVSAGIVYRQSDFNYGIPFQPGAEAVRIDGVRRALQARAGITTGKHALSYVRLDGTAQWYTHDEVAVADGSVGTSYNLRAQTASVTGKTQLGILNGSIGAQMFLRQYEPLGAEAFTPAADNTNVAAYIYQELPLAQGRSEDRTPRLQFGGRFDAFSLHAKAGADPRFRIARSRAFNNTSGSVGLSIPLIPNVTLSGSVARAFRAPTVEELYANGFHAAVGTFDIGDPKLKVETSTGLDVVLRAQRTRGFLQFSAYRNRIDNYILPLASGVTIADGDTVPRVFIGQRGATLSGFEFSGEAQLARRVVLGGLADAVRGTGSNNTNLPFIPAARLGASLRYDTGRWSVGTDARRVFRQTRVADDNVTDVPTESYTLLNLDASMNRPTRRAAHAITLRIENLLDARYADATSRIKAYTFNPGRNVSLVYRLSF
jgi:iron complex outermembrane recepter protein